MTIFFTEQNVEAPESSVLSSLRPVDVACCAVCKRWNDFQLAWQPEHFGSVTHTRVPISKLWYPDLVVINRCAYVMLCWPDLQYMEGRFGHTPA